MVINGYNNRRAGYLAISLFLNGFRPICEVTNEWMPLLQLIAIAVTIYVNYSGPPRTPDRTNPAGATLRVPRLAQTISYFNLPISASIFSFFWVFRICCCALSAKCHSCIAIGLYESREDWSPAGRYPHWAKSGLISVEKWVSGFPKLPQVHLVTSIFSSTKFH